MKPINVLVKDDLTFDGKPCFSIYPVWGDVDRPSTFGWSVLTKKLKDRLIAAILAGAPFKNPHILKDVNGKTYVGFDLNVFGRTMNSDLKKLGY